MGQVLSIANQKGGVGKTTSAVNLSAEIARTGKKVLLIDFDPQGNATSGLGVEFNPEGADLYDMFLESVPLKDLIRESLISGLYVAPSSKDLISIEVELGKTPGRELILNSELSLLREEFDYILIDCPPSSGLLTLNALGASTGALIPLQAEYYALEGISGILSTVEFVKQTFNPDLDILGVFITMYDSRTNLSAQVLDEAKNFFGKKVFKTVVPRNVRLSEAPSHGEPICIYDPSSTGAKAYKSLSKELLKLFPESLYSGRVANS